MPENFNALGGHDAYELLGVEPDASRQDIRLAYRALARSHHPDLFTAQAEKAQAEEHIRLLNAARDILDDHRSAYDAFRCADDVEEPADYEIIDDPWDTAQAGAAPPKPAPAPAPGYVPPRPAPAWSPPPHVPPARPPGAPMRLRDHGFRHPVGCLVIAVAIFVVPFAIDVIKNLSASGPEPSASVPDSLAGTWKGTVARKSGDKSRWGVEITLHAGKRNGDVTYLDGQCTGTAVPVSYKAGKLTVSTEFSKEHDNCDVGDFELTLKHAPRAAIAYHDQNGKLTFSGVLTAK